MRGKLTDYDYSFGSGRRIDSVKPGGTVHNKIFNPKKNLMTTYSLSIKRPNNQCNNLHFANSENEKLA